MVEEGDFELTNPNCNASVEIVIENPVLLSIFEKHKVSMPSI